MTLLATGFVLVSLFRSHVERRFDAELATHLDQLLAVLQPGENRTVALTRPLTEPKFERPYSALYWQVEGPDGTLLRSRSLWDQTLVLPKDSPADGEMHRHIVPGPDGQRLVAVERKVSLPGQPDMIRAAIAGDLNVVSRATGEFVRTTTLALGILAVGLVLAIVVQAVSTLRPLTRLQASLAAARLGRAASLAGQFPSEVQPRAVEPAPVAAAFRTGVARRHGRGSRHWGPANRRRRGGAAWSLDDPFTARGYCSGRPDPHRANDPSVGSYQ